MLILGLLGCSGSDKGASDEACERTCLDFEQTALYIAEEAGPDADGLTSETWRALCAEAPTDTTCETCWMYIQQAAFDPIKVGMDCGCGFDAAGVLECSQGAVTEEEAVEIAATCGDDCPYY